MTIENTSEADLTPDECGILTSGRVNGVPVGHVAAAVHVFAARESAAATRARAEERGRIAQAIEGEHRGVSISNDRASGYSAGLLCAVRIARGDA